VFYNIHFVQSYVKILFNNCKEMSNQPTPGVFIELAYNSNAFFSDSQKGDVCIRTANSNQKLLFGVNKDSPSLLGMDASNMIVKGNIAIGGSSNPSEVLDVRNGNAYFDSNIYVMNQLSIGSTQPTEGLDLVNGNAKLNSNLYVINNASIGITDSNPTETLDIGSNLKVRSNAYVMYRFAVGKSNPNEVVDIEGNTKIANNLYTLQNLSVGTSNPRENVDILANAIIRSNAYVMRRMSIGSSNPTEVLDVIGNEKITGRLFVTSNIGAGTSNPTERLDVYDNTKIRGDLYALNKLVVGQSASNPNETLDVRGNTKIGTNLYVMSNVSFGSSNPTEKLDVLGNTKIQGNFYTTNRISVGHSNPTERIDVSGNILASSNVYAMQNIGIGTVFPTERLEVTGNAKVLSNLYVVQKVGVGNSNPEETVHISGGNTKIDQSLYVMSQVGVGKSNPSETVDIVGNLKLTGNIYSMNNIAVGLSNPSEQAETSSNLKVGSNLYVISRLGVATSNPSETTDIIGNIKVSSNIYTSHAIVIGGASNPTEKFDLVGNAKMSSNLYVLSNIAIAHSNPTEKLDILGNLKVSSNIYTSNAIVIGGRSNPTEKLDLVGNAKMSSNLYVLSNIAISHSNPTEKLDILGNLKVSSNIYTSNAIVIGGNSNPSEKLDLVGNAKMSSNLYVLSNIAIAHSNPTEKLDIQGNLKVSSNIYTSNAIVIGGRSNPTEKLDLVGNAKMSSNLYVLSNIAIAHSNPTEKLDILGNIKVSSNIYTSNAIVIGGSSNPSEKLDLVGNAKMSSNLYVLSNVAIAHSNPTEKLDILGNLKVSSNIYTSNAIVIGGNSNPSEKLDLVGNAKMSSNLYVLSNIAIAHSNPTEKLDILGNLKVSSNIYTSNAIVIGGRSNPSEKLDLVGNAKMSSNLYVLNRLSINSSNPAVGLEVNTTDAVLLSKGTSLQRPSVPILGHIRYNTDNSQFEGFGAGSAWGSLGGVKSTNQQTYISAEEYPTSNDDIIRFYNSNIESMRITRQRLVGIGITTPTEKLDLVGNVKISSNAYILGSLGVNTSNMTEKLQVTSGKIYSDTQIIANSNDSATLPSFSFKENSNTGMFHASNDAIGFTTSGSEKLRIDAYGNIGIGKSNPSYKLDVNGSIYALGYCNLLLDSYLSTSTSNAPTANALKFAADAAIYTSNVLFLSGGNGTASLANMSTSASNTAYWSSNNLVKKSGDTMTGTLVSPYIGVNTSTPSERVDITGNLKVSSNIYISNRIGVNTSNPSQAIHVVGNMRLEGNLDVNGIVNTINTDVQLTDQFTVSNNGTGPALKVYQIGAQPVADFYDDTTLALRIADGGNVGIGTGTPSAKLQVAGVISTRQTGETRYHLYNDGGVAEWKFGQKSSTAHDLIFSKVVSGVDTDYMTINTSGNVGIGTSSPSAKLQVVGHTISSNLSLNDTRLTFKLLSDSNHMIYNNADNKDGEGVWDGMKWNTFNGFWIRGGNANGATPTTIMYGSNNGNVGIGTASPTYKLDVAGNVNVGSTSADYSLTSTGQLMLWGNRTGSIGYVNMFYAVGSNNSTTGDHVWYTRGNFTSGTERMRILSGGNVGIGTNSPVYKVDVSGDVRATQEFISTGNNSWRIVSGNYGTFIRNDGSDFYIMSTNSGDQYGNWSTLRPFRFNFTSGTTYIGDTAICAQNLGNVGIGTLSPGFKLDVLGTVGITNTGSKKLQFVNDSTTNRHIVLYETANNEHQFFGFGINADTLRYQVDSTNNKHVFYAATSSSASTELMRIQGNGNLGIGTASPAYSLHVSSNIATNGTSIAVENPNTGTLGWAAVAARNSLSTTNGGMRMGILGTGWTNSGIYQQNGGFLQCDQSNGISVAATSNSGSIRFYAGGTTEVMRINSNQNVGVGTTAPSAKLHVVGNTTLDGGNTIVVQNNQDGGTGRGIYMWTLADTNWGIYMGTPGASKSLAGATAVAGNGGITSHAIRIRVGSVSTQGFILENSSESLLMSVRASDGLTYFAGNATACNAYIGNYSGDNTYAQFSHATLSNSSGSYGLLHNNTGTTFLNCATGQAIRFRENNGDMAIITGGKMGIGTTNPAYTLDVNGVVNIKTGGLKIIEAENTYLGMNAGGYAPSLGIIKKTGTVPYFAFTSNQGSTNLANAMYFGMLDGSNLAAVGSCNLTAFMTLANSGNLGIGNSSPTYKLDVAHGTSASAVIRVGDTSGGYGRLMLGNSSHGIARGASISGATDANDVSVHTGGAGSITLATAGGEGLRVNASGNVGVGTASPSYKLDVNGVIRVANGILMNQNDDTYIGISATNSAPALGLIKKFASLPCFAFTSNYANSTSGNAMYFSMLSGSNLGGVSACNLTTFMTLNNAGNLGIGTTTPAYKLDVQGTVGITNTGSKKLQFANDTTTNRHIVLYEGANDEHQYYGFGVNSSTLRYQVAGTTANHIFYAATSSTASTELMRIQGNGNVGIGTNNPSYKLDVSGSLNATTVYQNGTTLNTVIANAVASYLPLSSGTLTNALTITETTGSVGSPSGGTLTLKHNNSGGSSSIVFTSTVNPTSDYAYIKYSDHDISTYFPAQTGTLEGSRLTIGVENDTATDGETIVIKGGYGIAYDSQRHYFVTGNVGIGTASPSARLEVNGIIKANDVVGSFTGTTNFTQLASDGAVVSKTANYLRFGTADTFGTLTNWSEKMRIHTDGNVGIGTSTPAYKLDVTGDTRITGSLLLGPPTGDTAPVITARTVPVGQGEGTQRTELILFHGNDPANGAGTDTITLRAPGLRFQTYNDSTIGDIDNDNGANDRMYIDPTGNVGIGITSPSHKLSVSGDINFTGTLYRNGSAFSSGGGTQWTSSGSSIYVGATSNVGIGTASPSYPLQVNGTIYTTSNVYVNNGQLGTPSIGGLGGIGDRLILWGGTASFHPYSMGISFPTMWYSVPLGAQHQWYINGVVGMTLSNNNLGIGTSTPSAPLHVTAGSSTEPTGNGIYVYNPTATSTSHAVVGVRTNTSAGGNPYYSWDIGQVTGWSMGISNADSDKLVIKANWNFSGDSSVMTFLAGTGNVGLGSTNPAAKLHVNTSGTSSYIRVSGDVAQQQGIEFVDTATRWIMYKPQSSTNLRFYDGAGDRMTLESGGNVGIGTTTPSQRLDVNGTIKGTNYIFPNDTWIPTADGKNRLHFGVNGRSYYRAEDGHEWRSSTDSFLMYLTNGGNLGIGASPGTYRLYVSGEIYATNDITAFSDIRAKSNLEKIQNPLDKIQQINGYTYDFLTDNPSQTKITERYAGLVAQEVEKILPEVVHKAADGKLSIAYGNMAGLFVESIKELKKENNELKVENQVLKTKLTDVEDKLARLESIINNLHTSQ
jgi:trimeric autotransporter adhesin